MEKIKIGFLPMYIKLYDVAKNGAARRPRLEGFAKRLIGELEGQGMDVVTTPDLCRIRPEFEAAIASFEAAGVLMMCDKKRFGIVSLVFAILIAISRIYLCVHYPTDVLAGVLLGLLFAFIACKAVDAVVNLFTRRKSKS